MPLKLGIPRETAVGEKRVSIDPVVLSQLVDLGVKVFVEKGAGDSAYFHDDTFDKATIVEDYKELTQIADVIWKIQAPTPDEVKQMREGSVLISMLNAHNNIAMLKALEENKITSFSMELIPAIARAQSMSVDTSQGSIAGYKAAIMGADLAPKFFPMLSTPAGTIAPAKVMVIGADAAGLQAISTAKRLGATVEAYDVRPETKLLIESLGANSIDLKIKLDISKGELTASERDQQQKQLVEHVTKADVLITCVKSSSKIAPKIIPQSTVEKMKQGSVVIDLAAEHGGNCSLSKKGKTLIHNGVVIHAPINVASQMPMHASQMYAKNLVNFTALLINENGEYTPNFEDEIVLGALLTKDGEVMHEGTLELLNKTLGEKI
ncbi:UNVERIFIED_CONTAM: hypothetical protein GTU68_065380 [Idotea baltica]|nr:hypothetical protein [Idotea baltica]